MEPVRKGHTSLIWCERALWITGFIFLGWFLAVWFEAQAYQAYSNWVFEQQLARDKAPERKGVEIGLLLEWLASDFRHGDDATLDSSSDSPASSGPSTKSTAPSFGLALGRLEVPRLDLSVMIRKGADGRTLRRAVGHIPGTAEPGEDGNIGIAGHRDTFFRSLKDIREQDEIILQTVEGTYRYKVEWTKIVGPNAAHVLKPTHRDSLTLVTCYPFYYVGHAPKRFIVRARQIATD